MTRRQHSQNARDDWRTPPEFFAGLHGRFLFSGDAFASADNTLCTRHMTGEAGRDALVDDWFPQLGRRPFVQPPYSRLAASMERTIELWHRSTTTRPVDTFETAVALIPTNMETKPWQEGAANSDLPGVLGAASEIWMVRRRIGFIDPTTGAACAKNVIGSAVAVFDHRHRLGTPPRLGTLCARTGEPIHAHDWDYWRDEVLRNLSRAWSVVEGKAPTPPDIEEMSREFLGSLPLQPGEGYAAIAAADSLLAKLQERG